MLNDVKQTVTDGLLGLSDKNGSGLHIKIGASPIESANPISITNAMSLAKIREKLGYSPLADSVMDSIENGSIKILCIPVKASTDGVITAGTKVVATDSGDISLTGKPYNSFQIIIQITGQGVLNTASFKYSIDGGNKYSDEITVPLSGKYNINVAGIEIDFTLGADKKFNVGDTFNFSTTAPQMTNSDVLTAIDLVKSIKDEFELVHIVGGSQPDLWIAVSAKQVILQNTYHKEAFFVMEAYEKPDAQEILDYVYALEEAKKQVNNYNIQVVAARALYVGMDNITRNINLAGVVTGMYAQVAPHKSIGETAVMSISEYKITKLLPEGITIDEIGILDAARYLTFRQYDGLDGYFVTNANMMCPDGSDYKYAEDVRILNKIRRKTRAEALLQLQADIDTENVEGDLAAKAEFIKAPLEDMIDKKEISGVKLTIPSDQDILTSETLSIVIRYAPKGKIRMLDINLGVYNPYASTN